MFISVWVVGSSFLPQCRSALLLVYQQQVFLYSVKEELAVDAHIEIVLSLDSNQIPFVVRPLRYCAPCLNIL